MMIDSSWGMLVMVTMCNIAMSKSLMVLFFICHLLFSACSMWWNGNSCVVSWLVAEIFIVSLATNPCNSWNTRWGWRASWACFFNSFFSIVSSWCDWSFFNYNRFSTLLFSFNTAGIRTRITEIITFCGVEILRCVSSLLDLPRLFTRLTWIVDAGAYFGSHGIFYDCVLNRYLFYIISN